MNKTIKLLMVSDIFLLTGFGLIDPILAIFIKDDLQGGTIFAAGLASALFLVVKSLVQLPFSRYVDRQFHRKKWLLLGMLLSATVPFIYIFAQHINAIYLAQVIQGIGSGLAFPVWLSLWSTNLDKHQESFEWSLYSTITGLGTAATAAVGAAVAEFLGFTYTFLMVAVMTLTAGLVLLGLQEKNSPWQQAQTIIRHFKERWIKRRFN